MRRRKFFALSMIMVMLLFGAVGCGKDSNMDETKPPYNDETNKDTDKDTNTQDTNNKDTNNKDTNNLEDDIKEGVEDAGDAIQDGIDDITNPQENQGTDLR